MKQNNKKKDVTTITVEKYIAPKIEADTLYVNQQYNRILASAGIRRI
jgi:hypothetical protein